jgi:hypothetical protein
MERENFSFLLYYSPVDNSLLGQINLIHGPMLCYFKVHLMLISHVSLGFPSKLYISLLLDKILCISHFYNVRNILGLSSSLIPMLCISALNHGDSTVEAVSPADTGSGKIITRAFRLVSWILIHAPQISFSTMRTARTIPNDTPNLSSDFIRIGKI